MKSISGYCFGAVIFLQVCTSYAYPEGGSPKLLDTAVNDTRAFLALHENELPDEALVSRIRYLATHDYGENTLTAWDLLYQMQGVIRAQYDYVIEEINKSDKAVDESIRESAPVGYYLYLSGRVDSAVDVLVEEGLLLHTGAINYMEHLCENGDSPPPAYLEFFRQYADEGIPRGEYIHGKLLLSKAETPEEIAKAIEYLDVSTLPEAYWHVFDYAFNKDDHTMAEKYLRKLVKMDDAHAAYELAIYAQEREEFETMADYLILTLELDADYYPAQLELARAYINGWGVDEDLARGIRMMFELADCPDDEIVALACLNLAIIHAKGIGVEKSGERAKMYIQRVHDLDVPVPPGILEIVYAGKIPE